MKIEFWNGHGPHQSIRGQWSKEELSNIIGDLWSQNEHIVLYDWGLNILGKEIIK
jgi:hypothetical protein